MKKLFLLGAVVMLATGCAPDQQRGQDGSADDGTKVYVPTRGLDALVLVDAAMGTLMRTKVFDAATCGNRSS